jgi:energy-coupling factor transport system permease protein
MIGHVTGRSPLHRAHPYTPLALGAGLFAAAFAAPSPLAVALVLVAALAIAAAAASLGATLRPLLVLALPVWVLLLVVHGWRGPEPFFMVGELRLSEPGLTRALVLGGRVSAILIVSVAVLRSVAPARLVEAMAARGVSFGRMYLLVSTLTIVPRLRERAAHILEAQQCRGLRIGGSPLARLRALGPLVLPLVLGALAEVDEQVLALDARGVTGASRRTSLWPPADPVPERALRWGVLLIVTALYLARFAGMPA